MTTLAFCLLISLCLFNTSCVTQKACLNKFPPIVNTIVKDTTIYRDTVLFVYLPADTVRDSVPVYINSEGNPITLGRIITETDYARAEAWVSDSKLYQVLFHKQSALELRYDSLLREKQKTITITKTVQLPCEVTTIDRLVRLTKWIFALAAVVFIGIFVIRIKK